ncbi:MAG: glycoside hydrolase family 16 protein [Pontiellaceae bacterium]|nr:glycoside hydrolase family 16 protein [Pontiellaceae bacterium]MBN2786026.1 glycoside hydrolase family 16 protein [Pontiellaceae bacterium]
MTTPLQILFIVLGLATYAGAVTTNDYKLVWADEFDTNGKPNPANWTYESGFVRNNELQWYQSDNALCRDGLLVIEGRREQKPNPQYDSESHDWRRKRSTIEYTSACLITKGLQSWQYGRFEIKARIRTRPGLWPAIWFLGVDGQWPHNGEIDLLEYYDDSILANACWGTTSRFDAKWDSVKLPLNHFGQSDWDSRFHVWRMDWDAESIKLYLDDELLNTISQAQAVNDSEKWGPKKPFQQPHYLLLNLAIGGNQGGDPSGTDFPSRYEIDYVRVYQKNP